jgi:2'-5' RNA ligase
MENFEKRIFFGFEVSSPFSEEEPKGRYIEKDLRHLTLVFIGNVAIEKVETILKGIEKPNFLVSPVGIFNKILFLPYFSPRVVAFHINFLNSFKLIEEYRLKLLGFLKKNDIPIKNSKKFLPHVTVCRRPFKKREWRDFFTKKSLFVKSLTLFESFKNSKYERLWSHEFIPPFKELEHTADIAFEINGKDFLELYKNAFIALCFKFPEMIDYFIDVDELKSIEDVIIKLNDIVRKIDIEKGSPLKAVSFQSKIKTSQKNILTWEMIVDV